MSNKVDISEVIEFSDEVKLKSEQINNSISQIKQDIEELMSMNSFTGKTADQAKMYFSHLHITVLEAFDGLFHDLDQNLKKHIESFRSQVDESKESIVTSNYLMDIDGDIQDAFEKLNEVKNEVTSIINNVSDISSATNPSFHSVSMDKEKMGSSITDLEDNLNSFTATGKQQTSGAEEVLHHIKITLDNAGAVKGSARFTDYQGNNTAIGLTELKSYNQTNRQVTAEKIENLDEDAKIVYDQAKEDYENGELEKSVYDSIVSGVINSGAAFVKNALSSKVTNEVSERVASSVVSWAQRNTWQFVDPALAFQTVGGAVVTNGAPPSALTSAIRTGARYGAPIVGSAIDFGIQVYNGEDATDAAIKTAGHLGAGLAGAAIGSAIPVPVLGTAVGFAVGVGGSMLFDFVYDNKDAIISGVKDFADGAVNTAKEVGGAIGDAAKGLFNGLGSVFG
ncbi:T7SS effector LXG polymorphic toxin [Oceanobacillus manasiensis]|uniref:T7SS effector LXG polymorphic toxin n=1 Tax=Oceanobacillus manasiensis TaxID=586413 RepID=UPI000693C12A|nr:T7SS effector LXG polymorphic toxin [Oceanobacillus manasiensis]